MQTQLAIFNISETQQLADWSSRVLSCSIRSGVHGFESCEADLQIPFLEAFTYYQQLGPLKLRVSWGPYKVWEGRLEDPTQFAATNVGLKITAFGQWVAFSDAPYTALWSDTQYNRWRISTQLDRGQISAPERYQIDLNKRIYIAPQKNATYANGGANLAGAEILYEPPHLGNKQCVGISFDWVVTFPNVNWLATVYRCDEALSTFNIVFQLAGNGAAQVGSSNEAHTASDRYMVQVVYNAAAAVFAGETGSALFQITNLRIVTSNTNRINTTFTVARAAGANVTATVGSTARMYIGQQLQIINVTGFPSETVTVLSIGSSTQFNATFVNAYAIGDLVRALVVYPDEIYKDLVSKTNTLNPTQLSSDTSLIQSQSVDISDAIYEDQSPADVINDLLPKSDNQATPRQWVALLYSDLANYSLTTERLQKLITRPRGSGRAWYVDVTSLEVVRTLTELYNSVYAVYKDTANKRKLRTVATTQADSVVKFGITRRKAVEVDTTDSVQATRVRDSVLALQRDPIPRASIELDRVFDAIGNPWPLWMIHADDTLNIRNLPVVLGIIYDKIRILIITRTDYDVMTNKIKLELEIPLPAVDVQLANALKG